MPPITPFAFAYPDLPILAGREAILKALEEHPAIVVQGGTGSGKTTQLPKFLLEAGWSDRGLIGVTQPRRIAALAIADRLRQETRPELIGAKIRFHEDVPPGARVKVMTDGILLQEFRRDPLLRRYSCIVLDEAHERSLNVDILLGIFKRLLPRRRDFRLVVTSATLDAERFATFLGAPTATTPTTTTPPAAATPSAKAPPAATPGVSIAPGKAPVIEVEGRQYPVNIEYWDPEDTGGADDPEGEETPSRAIPPVEAAAMAIRDLQARRPDNLLCFLPTEKEINELHRELERDLGNRFLVLPLYSRLGPADQKKVFQDSHKPKIILATNIAETSLTIPGIGYVVDTGLARVSRYHAQTKIQGLPIERISQASARQRAGRAGRVKPGVCIRLYGEEEFATRPAFTEPEILRSNLANVVLQLLALGLSVDDFPFPDPPAPAALKGAFRQLHELGAVDGPETSAALTDEGHRLSRIPVDVALGKILLKASDFGALQPAVILAAGVTVQDPRFLPKEEPDRQKAAALHRRFEDPRSDFVGLLALWIWIHKEWDSYSQRRLRRLCLDNYLSYNRVREWMDLREQFARLLKVASDSRVLQLGDLDADALHKSILSGFLPFLARKKPEDPSYRLAGDKEAFLHPGSSLSKRKPEWIVAAEVRQTSRTFIYRACEIKPAWVEEIAPEACKRSYFNVAWNPERGFVEAVERVSYKGFAIRQDRRVNYESVAPEECAEIFWREGAVRAGGGAPFPFRENNQAVLDALAALERKARLRGLVPDEDALVHWYRERAPGVTSRVRLERFLQGKPLDGDANLKAWEAREARQGQEGRGKPGERAGIGAGIEASTGAEARAGAGAGEDGRQRPLRGASPAPAGNSKLEFSLEDWAAPLASLDAETWLAGTSATGTPAGAGSGSGTVPGSRPATPVAMGRGMHPLERLFPDLLESGDHLYAVSYRFDYGDPGDGATLETDPAGLASLTLPALFHGLPGWRASIWDWALEKLSAKAREKAQAGKAGVAAAWAAGIPLPESAGSEPVASPAAALAAALAPVLEGAGSVPAFPAVWPSHLCLHVLVKSPSGRRLLLHVAPDWGDAELFAGARALAFGEAAAARPFGEWLEWARQNHGEVPPPLQWRGLAYGVQVPGAVALAATAAMAATGASAATAASAAASAASAGGDPAACGFFADAGEARFHHRLAAALPPPARRKDAAHRALRDFIARRLQSLIDAWSCPDTVRKDSAAWRAFLAEDRLPALALEAYGPQEAQARVEKDLPPVRATLPKPGAQVKSLASLGQAVSRGGEPGSWVGALLTLHAGGLSWEAFARWYAFFAQPPVAAKPDIAELVRVATAPKSWEAMLLSAFHGSWAAAALEDTIPALRGGPATRAGVPAEGFEGMVAAWEAARLREETLRKGAKARRDALASAIAALGQNLGGLPQELRGALETLDKPAPWTAKVQAGLSLELHLHKQAGKAGGAPAVPGAKPDAPSGERKDQLLKGLSGRFKKL